MRKWIVQVVAPLLCGLAVLLSVIIAGRSARASLHERAMYSLAFTDIDCQPPEGRSRVAFLQEVRSLTTQPQTLHLLDGDLGARLHRAFLAHPYVESVCRVVIEPGDSHAISKKKKVRIEMEYRRPVLAVPLLVADERGTQKRERAWRIVDRRGIWLSLTDSLPHVPVLLTDVAPPAGQLGSHWGDARVTAAAQTAAFLQTHLPQLHLEDCQMEVIEGEILLRRPGVCILWGHAPGKEAEDEALAAVKLSRLLDYQRKHDGLESLEHDVRLLAYQGHFPLASDRPQQTVSLTESSLFPLSRKREPISNSSRSWRSCFNEAKPPSVSTSSR